MQTLALGDIHVGHRHRNELGRIDELATSIERCGLLHPPVVTTDRELVCGLRRLEAVKRLGWKEIEVRIIDPEDMIRAEHDENQVRKDFTASEMVAIARTLERFAGQRRGRPARKTDVVEEIRPERAQFPKGQKTAKVAAAKAGFSSRQTYQRAAKVVDRGAPELVEAMDRNEVSIDAAAVVAELPPVEQAEVVAAGPAAVTAKAADMRRGKSRVNGHLGDDPPDIARARAAGRIAPEVVPEVTEATVSERSAPESDLGDDALSDEEWLATLPLGARLSPSRLKVFQADALDYRRCEPARKAFQHATSRALKGNGEWAYRVRKLLKTDHPKHWLICPATEHGGCGGSGEVALLGQCSKCRGRGYYLR